jgi:hypothetical protein
LPTLIEPEAEAVLLAEPCSVPAPNRVAVAVACACAEPESGTASDTEADPVATPCA